MKKVQRPMELAELAETEIQRVKISHFQSGRKAMLENAIQGRTLRKALDEHGYLSFVYGILEGIKRSKQC